jgi:vacuolar-type H+-ATPase subunit H
MEETDSLDEAEALAKLREHERELDRQLESARQQAAGLLAEARQTAERLSGEADSALREEVERFRQDASRDLERSVAATHDETGRRIEALRHEAGRNREQALTWLLSRVVGRDTP